VVTNRWVGLPLAFGALYLFYKAFAQLATANALSVWRIQQFIFGLLLGGLAVLFLLGVVERRVVPWLGQFQADTPLPLLPLFIAALDVPIELVMINTATNNYAHYFMAILPGFTILIAYFVMMLVSWMDAGQKRVMPLVWAILFLLPILQNGTSLILDQSQVGKDDFVTKMVAYVQENTKEDDYVLTWGFNAQVNFLANRRFPTRYITQQALFREGYGSPAKFEAFLNELKAHPPKLILDTHLNSFPFVTWSLETRQCSPAESVLPAGFEKVRNYICQNYELVESFGKDQWLVYRLRTS
jgi:hypothetical protein